MVFDEEAQNEQERRIQFTKKRFLFWGSFKSQGKEKSNNFIQFLIDSHDIFQVRFESVGYDVKFFLVKET
jgi:hypothetical protein